MNWVLVVCGIIAIFGLLLFVDTKIKGNKSIIVKITSVVFFIGLLCGLVYIYGQSFLESFQVDVKSFTNIKAFFSSRIIGALAILLMLLFVLFKTIYVTISLCTNTGHVEKGEKAITLLVVFFDIAVIPNILNAGSFNVLFVALAIISLVETGLALTKLVFSFQNKQKLVFVE